MDNYPFELHDVKRFPRVTFLNELTFEGYARQWMAEMESLLQRQEKFVIIFPAGGEKENREDRKLRGIWLKENKLQMQKLCAGLVVIEPLENKRQLLLQQSAAATQSFGVSYYFVADQQAADTLASSLI